MEKVTRRVIKRWTGISKLRASKMKCPDCSIDYAQDHADLGATLNGFSLNESGALSAAVEKTGQAADATYMSTTKLVSRSNPC